MSSIELRRVTKEVYLKDPSRYELRSGQSSGAPNCPYGNHYQWIGFDNQEQEYIRFSKSVFKTLLNNRQHEIV